MPVHPQPPGDSPDGRAIPDEPLISIVTPSFNQADYLEQAIQSVLGQDYGQIEYIVIDGGSSDGSLEIIERYADQLAFWVSEPDQGQADAINKGLRRARGHIVAWLNSDDIYLQGALRGAAEQFMRTPLAGMVYGDGIMVDAALKLLDRHYYPQVSVVDLLSFEVILQPATFMNKSVLEQVGFLDPDYNLILDHELWVRIAAHSPVIHVPAFWALERTHEQAKTIALASSFVEEAERMVSWAAGSVALREIVEANRSRIYAGLNVFAGRRLIDSGAYRTAFQRIRNAARLDPPTVWKYWYKVVQAGLSGIGLDWLFETYRRLRRRLTYGEVNVDWRLGGDTYGRPGRRRAG